MDDRARLWRLIDVAQQRAKELGESVVEECLEKAAGILMRQMRRRAAKARKK